jgi:acyl carrier protein
VDRPHVGAVVAGDAHVERIRQVPGARRPSTAGRKTLNGTLRTEFCMHDDDFQKVAACFEKVFDGLDPRAIPSATPGTVSGWDSVAHITLLSLIGEEFGIEIDFEEFAGATSFETILQLVRVQVRKPASAPRRNTSSLSTS